MKQDAVRITLRIGRPLHENLLEISEKNMTSLNSEIVRSIRERMERMPPSPSTAAVQGLPPP